MGAKTSSWSTPHSRLAASATTEQGPHCAERVSMDESSSHKLPEALIDFARQSTNECRKIRSKGCSSNGQEVIELGCCPCRWWNWIFATSNGFKEHGKVFSNTEGERCRCRRVCGSSTRTSIVLTRSQPDPGDESGKAKFIKPARLILNDSGGEDVSFPVPCGNLQSLELLNNRKYTLAPMEL